MEIRKIIRLDTITEESQVIGISSLNNLAVVHKRDIPNSRGEFAGYCCNDNCVYIFRDRLGARSIFYAIDGMTLVISTDLGWLSQQVKSEPNWIHILTDYKTFQIPFAEHTFFKGIYRVMPGEIVCINQGGVKKETYWQPQFGNESFDPVKLLRLISNAVSFRLDLIGNKPFTSYLSGGIDSSSITMLAKPEECFSGYYSEDGYSEMDYINAVMRKVDRPYSNNPIKIKEYDFMQQLRNLPLILPNPCAGLGVIPQMMIAQEASKSGYKYSFTGEGGDEVFLGYNWNTVLLSLAGSARGMKRDRYMVRYEPMIDKVLNDGFATLAGGLLARDEDMIYATRRILDIWQHGDAVENNIHRINLKVGLPAILWVDEAVGKFAGVEPVSPLMDHHVVEYVCSVRPEERAPIPKHMLREAMKDILPEKIRTRYDKMGFPVPFAQWKWNIRPTLESLKCRDMIEVDLEECRTMDRKTWALYSVGAWCDHYFGGQY